MANANTSSTPTPLSPLQYLGDHAVTAAGSAPTTAPQGPLPASLREYFTGKHILVTGVTGFVGKVFLEKVLREFPNIGRIYVLTRPKKGIEAQERLQRDVLKSQCFDVLREQLGGEAQLMELFRSKVEAIEGDLEAERLGLSEKRTAHLVSVLNCIAHIAATIDFNERFDIAIRQNVLGALRMLALARRCVEVRGAGFDSFVHISTCYVNWPRHGSAPVLETLYPLPFDPRQLARRVLDMDPSEIEEETPRLLTQYKYPNTYTITKSMAEHLLMEVRGDVPFCIVRPAIIGASLREPMPGWTDTLSAAGGLVLMCGLGLLKEMPADGVATSDIVPVDLVVNATLRALHVTAVRFRPYALTLPTDRVVGNKNRAESAYSAATSTLGHRSLTARGGPTPPSASIYHCGTSGSSNAASWTEIRNQIVFFWLRHPHPRTLTKKPTVYFCRNDAEFAIRFYLLRQMPVNAFGLAARLPLASDKMKKDAEKLQKAVTQSKRKTKLFIPFTNKNWVFDHTLSNAQLDPPSGRAENGVHLTEDERVAFALDYDSISWRVYMANFCWGLMQFVTKDGPKSQMQDPSEGGHAVLLRAML